MILLAIAGFLRVWDNVSGQSLTDFSGTEKCLRAYWDVLPEKALVFVANDNAQSLLVYRRYVVEPASKRWLGLQWEAGKDGSQFEKVGLPVNRHLLDPISRREYQRFRVPPISLEQAASWPVFVEVPWKEPGLASHALPWGGLFLIATFPTTQAQVLQADDEWKSRFPDLFPSPSTSSHRLERDAWNYIHRVRGMFFQERGLWEKAVESFRLSLAWLPDSFVHVAMAECLVELGRKEEACESYLEAIRLDPGQPGIRNNLGIVLLGLRRVREAMGAFRDEVEWFPGDASARENLRRLSEGLAKNGAGKE